MRDRRRPAPTRRRGRNRTLRGNWLAGVRTSVLSWSEANGRDFPWRRTRDPYKILIAEILLRQTQARRVIGPYRKLVKKFPNPASLAKADPADVRRTFRPLGLVRRAGQLLHAARILVDEHGGRVPRNLAELLRLPGLGTYSARAVMCLAFEEPLPMVDESSGRLLRRLVGLPDDGPAYSSKKLLDLAGLLVPARFARGFNLGLLDVAAAYCHVQGPHCSPCPLKRYCTYARCAGEW